MSRWLALGGIFLLALALRLTFFVGYANVDPWDDTLYLALAGEARGGTLRDLWGERAAALESGRVEAPMAFILRRGAYWPVALAQRVFGVNELASALPSLLASLGMLLVVYWLGCRLESEATGRWAALCFAVVPLDLVVASRILADGIQSFWVSFAVAATVEATRGDHSKKGRLGWYAIAGLGAYLAAVTRLNGLIVVPLIGIAAWPELRKASRWREPMLPIAVLFAALSIDGLFLWARTGHFLFALEMELAASRAMFQHNPEVVLRPAPFLAVHLSYEEGVPHHFFKLFWGTVQHYDGLKLFSAFAPLGFAALVVAVVRRRDLLLVCWLLGVFLYVQYGFRFLEWSADTGELHYFLNAPRLRYLELLLAPLCLLLGSLAVALGKRRWWWAWIFFVGLAAPSLFSARENHLFYRSSMDDLREAARFLADRPPSLVLTDGFARDQLPLYLGPGSHRVELLDAGSEPPPQALVLLGGSRGFEISDDAVAATLPPRYRALHLGREAPPAGWRVIHEHRRLLVYEVEGDGDGEIEVEREPAERPR